MNNLFHKISVDKVPRKNCVSPQFFSKELTTFFTLAMSKTTALAKGVEDWFGWLWEVIVMVVLRVVVLVVPCEGEDNLGTQGWVGADVIGAEFAVVTKGWEVAGESVDEGLLPGNGCRVVDEEN